MAIPNYEKLMYPVLKVLGEIKNFLAIKLRIWLQNLLICPMKICN